MTSSLLRLVLFGLLTTLLCMSALVMSGSDHAISAQNHESSLGKAKAIVSENDKGAVRELIKLIEAEKDPLVAQEMGMEAQFFDSEDAMEALADEVEGLTKPEEAFTALWLLTGIANGTSEAGDKIIENAIFESKDKEIFLKAAALEAMRFATRQDLTHLIVKLLTLNEEEEFDDNDWDDDHALVPITAVHAAGYLSTEDSKLDLMQGVVNVLKHVDNERVTYFAAHAAGRISGLEAYTNPDYWVGWILNGGSAMGGDAGDDGGRTSAGRSPAPKFFGTPAVGKRIVFVIDVSGSMRQEVTLPPQEPPPEKEKEDKGPTTGGGSGGKNKGDDEEEEEEARPDYSKVKNKLDLAVAELKFTLEHLDEDFMINIVTYDSDHKFLVSSWKAFQPASKSVKKKFMNELDKLAPGSLTNIHGALLRAFRVTDSGEINGNPAIDKDAISEGAETIFFLTDGAPCWDDQSTATDPQTMLGNGPFCTPEPIIKDIWRVNIFRKTVIHTVGVGPHHQGLMRALAANSSGKYKDLSGN